MSQRQRDFDVVVVGSGFGGSVAALRLTEKGYRVAVIEAGRRFKDKDFPKTSWRLSRFLYLPRLGLRGIQRIHALPDVLVLAGAGVGGGSLVYANTLYVLTSTMNNGSRSRIGNQNSLLGTTKHHEC
jgi:cholesterol oxidase